MLFRSDVVAGEVQSWQSRQNLGAYDQLPYAVRAAVSECPFLVDITRCPKGFDWPQAIERIKAVTTFKEAEEFAKNNANLLASTSAAGKFRQQMGVLTKQERAVRSAIGVSGKEKREALDEIRQMKIELSKEFSSGRE